MALTILPSWQRKTRWERSEGVEQQAVQSQGNPLFHRPIPPKLLSFLRLPSLPSWYFSPRLAATPPASAITGSQEVTAAPEHCIQCAQNCNAAIPADAMVHGPALKR